MEALKTPFWELWTLIPYKFVVEPEIFLEPEQIFISFELSFVPILYAKVGRTICYSLSHGCHPVARSDGCLNNPSSQSHLLSSQRTLPTPTSYRSPHALEPAPGFINHARCPFFRFHSPLPYSRP